MYVCVCMCRVTTHARNYVKYQIVRVKKKEEQRFINNNNRWCDDNNVHANYMSRQKNVYFSIFVCKKKNKNFFLILFVLLQHSNAVGQSNVSLGFIVVIAIVVVFEIEYTCVCECEFENYLVDYWRSRHLATDDRLWDRTTVACNRLMTLKLLQNAIVIL